MNARRLSRLFPARPPYWRILLPPAFESQREIHEWYGSPPFPEVDCFYEMGLQKGLGCISVSVSQGHPHPPSGETDVFVRLRVAAALVPPEEQEETNNKYH